MRALIRGAGWTAAAALLAAAVIMLPGTARASGGCTFAPPNTWVCVHTSRTPGRPGSSGGRSRQVTCTLTRLGKAQKRFLKLPPPPKGYRWEALTCPGARPFGGVVPVNNKTGRPGVSPRQLLQIALGELIIPYLRPATAPPRGSDGLVGLPEWFWIPHRDWRPVSITVSVGPVWARATAVPTGLAFSPGAGLPELACAGPGTPYDPHLPAADQHTRCSYTYAQPSAGQPGAAYRAAVIVTWRVSWTGSGGAGGVINAGLRIPRPFSLRIAEGQALVGGSP
jgi:hypothetical protein